MERVLFMMFLTFDTKYIGSIEVQYLHDLLRKVLRAPVFLDSAGKSAVTSRRSGRPCCRLCSRRFINRLCYYRTALTDLRILFTDGLHESDTVVLIGTPGVLTRPWYTLCYTLYYIL